MVEQASSGFDLASKENRSQITQLLRKKNLPEDVIRKLWALDYYRWSILRNQNLSSDIISEIIENDIMKKKVKNANKILSYLITHQNLKKEHYENIDHNKLSVSTILDIWNMKPDKFIEYGDLGKFYDILKDETILRSKNRTKFLKTVKNFCSKTDKLYDALDIFINYQNEEFRKKMIDILIRDNFIKDEYVNQIRSKFSEDEFKQIASLLIHRNHCSVSMKAKLLLLK